MEGQKYIAAGAIGSRIAGRLTADLILRSPQYMSCIGEYQIDLRAHKLTGIENLGATQNQFDSIDLSDNLVGLLEGFPQLHRLRSLYLSNNRIARISRGLEDAIPNLETLVLTNNRLKNLQDLNPLASLPRLQYLSLIGNEVAMKTDYRLYVIYRLKHLKHLDFRKIKDKERQEAEQRFGAGALPNGNLEASKTFEPGEGLPESIAEKAEETEAEPSSKPASGLTLQQQTAIKAAIQNAQTLQEVAEFEKALITGIVPSQFKEVEADGDTAEPMDEG